MGDSCSLHKVPRGGWGSAVTTTPVLAVTSNRGNTRFLVTAVAGVLACLVAGCVSVPQYDATTDTNLSALQSEIDAKLVEWGSDVRSPDSTVRAKATYAQSVAFYDKVDTDMESVELRMEAVPDASNRNLPQYFTNLRQMIGNVSSTQQQLDGLTPPKLFAPGVLNATRWQFAAQFAPLITYELTLKGVASTKKASTSSAATSNANSKAQAPPVAHP